MEEWAKQNLSSFWDGSLIVFVDEKGNNTTVISSLFSSGDFLNIVGMPTYAALTALSIAKQGWQKIFDQWKERGIIQ